MAYFLFIDESGHDERASPCQVLAGLCVRDDRVWPLITKIIECEDRFFGCRYGHVKEEFKGRKFLKKKVFRHAGEEPVFAETERRALAYECISGAPTTSRRISALAQSKLAFVREIFSIVRNLNCVAFASIVAKGAAQPEERNGLRKDYGYLFERFYDYLEDRGTDVQGAIVFDELEKSQSKILIGQMEAYFLNLAVGKTRARQIIPQPFFVHSDLTTLVQVSDLIAYCLSWGYEIPNSFVTVTREELRPFGDMVTPLRYDAKRHIQGKKDFVVWGFAAIDDLRTAREK